MANYEIMLIVSGSLDEKKAKSVAEDVSSSIKQTKPSIEEYGLKELAYKIGSNTHGYYFQYNFETSDPKLINEFRRLCGINKNVIRSLIINLEKDYGYRATVNPKKIERNKKRLEIYNKKKSEYEKLKESRQAEYLSKKEASENNDVTEIKEEKQKKPSTRKTTSKKSETSEKESGETKTTTKRKTTTKSEK